MQNACWGMPQTPLFCVFQCRLRVPAGRFSPGDVLRVVENLHEVRSSFYQRSILYPFRYQRIQKQNAPFLHTVLIIPCTGMFFLYYSANTDSTFHSGHLLLLLQYWVASSCHSPQILSISVRYTLMVLIINYLRAKKKEHQQRTEWATGTGSGIKNVKRFFAEEKDPTEKTQTR